MDTPPLAALLQRRQDLVSAVRHRYQPGHRARGHRLGTGEYKGLDQPDRTFKRSIHAASVHPVLALSPAPISQRAVLPLVQPVGPHCSRHGKSTPAAGPYRRRRPRGARLVRRRRRDCRAADGRLARRGTRRRRRKAATAAILRRLLAPIPNDLRGLRDRAVLLVGFAGALRRSELAAIRVEHLEAIPRGIRLTLPHSKGAQADAVTVPLPYGDTELCPVRALARWQDEAGITEGPVFRRLWLPPRSGGGSDAPPPSPRISAAALTPQSVALIVQARAMAAGFRRRELGGHSFKRGALTTGMDAGIHPARLKRLGRHKSFDVLGEYLEFGDLFNAHPLNGLL